MHSTLNQTRYLAERQVFLDVTNHVLKGNIMPLPAECSAINGGTDHYILVLRPGTSDQFQEYLNASWGGEVSIGRNR